MNAKELHDLYGPLWERVPETRPPGLCFGPEYSFRGTWIMSVDGGMCGERVIASLCRCAVEDWLVSRGFNFWPQKCKEGYHILGWAGPTLHHALVAAAMAVAEGKP